MKKALVFFTCFNDTPGGSEYLPLLLVEELQQRGCEVTLALNWRSDVRRAADFFGVKIDFSRFKAETVKPKGDFARKIDAIIPFFSTRRLKVLAKDADICISAANAVDFGKGAHHFIYLLRTFGDNAFLDFIGHAPPRPLFSRFRQKAKTFIAESLLRPLLGVRSTRRLLADGSQTIYPNSIYVDKVMRDFYGPFNGSVFYPPTTFEFTRTGIKRDPLKVAVLGQVFPEKRVDRMIAIVRRAMEITGLDFTIEIGGALHDTPYVASLKAMAAKEGWIRLLGAKYGAEKEDFLLSATYAIHAERDEAFGISVVEYMKAGLIPIVPDEGGTGEVVAKSDLTYRTDEEAASMLARLATDAVFRSECAAHAAERAKAFSRSAYMKRQHELLERIVG